MCLHTSSKASILPTPPCPPRHLPTLPPLAGHCIKLEEVPATSRCICTAATSPLGLRVSEKDAVFMARDPRLTSSWGEQQEPAARELFRERASNVASARPSSTMSYSRVTLVFFSPLAAIARTGSLWLCISRDGVKGLIHAGNINLTILQLYYSRHIKRVGLKAWLSKNRNKQKELKISSIRLCVQRDEICLLSFVNSSAKF